MKFAIVLFAILVVAYAETFDVEKEWTDFKTKFNKHYADETEETHRKGIFAEKLKTIEAHNKKFEAGEVTFTVGINEFSDQTHEEFHKTHTGRQPNPHV